MEHNVEQAVAQAEDRMMKKMTELQTRMKSLAEMRRKPDMWTTHLYV